MRKTKPEAKKSGSGYEHLPVRTQHIIDRLKFLETYRRVGRPTQSTLVQLEELSVQPTPTQGKGKRQKARLQNLQGLTKMVLDLDRR